MNAEDRSTTDIAAGIALIEKQIEAAGHLLKHPPVKEADVAGWNSATRSCLEKVYGQGSPNIGTIMSAAGETPVWMGMPPEVARASLASRLEKKVAMLKSCIVALKRRG